MVADDGRVVLMDFGTGLSIDGGAAPPAGTPLYLAPELVAGGEAGPRSDVYSVGVLLFHLLTGTYPVVAPDVRGLRAAHERGERRSVRSLAPGTPQELALWSSIARSSRSPNVASRRRTPSAPSWSRRRTPRNGARGSGASRPRPSRWALWRSSSGSSPLVQSAAPGGSIASSSLGSAGPAPTAQRAIAILPFDNLSPEATSDTLVDGLTEEVLRDLARVDGLMVRSRFSSFSFRGPQRDLRAVAERLDADLVVTGSVSRTDDRLRVNVELVDLATDRQLWANRFERQLDSASDVFVVVDEIARRVVDELRLSLGAGHRRYDVDLEAYEKYLRARDLVDRRGLVGPQQALPLLEDLVTEDATFAPAHAALSDAHAFLSLAPYQSGISSAAGLERMRRAATRAVDLDPMLAEAHAAMGAVLASDLDWSRAEESFERALALDRTLSSVYSSYSLWVLRPLRRFEQAERLLETALANDPLSLDLEREIAALLFTAGRHGEAIERLERVRSIDPDFPSVVKYLGRALVLAGRAEEGLVLLGRDAPAFRRYSPQPGSPLFNPEFRCHALMRLGRRAEAERAAVEARGFPQREVIASACLGDLDGAFGAIERMMELEPQRVPILLTFPELETLSRDPRLAELRKRLKLG